MIIYPEYYYIPETFRKFENNRSTIKFYDRNYDNNNLHNNDEKVRKRTIRLEE